jgi:hypothetical protein
MRREAAAAASVLLVLTGVVVACSSSSNNASSEAATPRADGGNCTSVCCDLPAPGTVCTAEAGTICAYATTCAEGLVILRSTKCSASFWEAIDDCPAAGGFDPRGCPSAQPVDGTPCTVDAQAGPVQCGYSKACSATSCDDAGKCVPIRASAQALCIQGVWQTTALGPC